MSRRYRHSALETACSARMRLFLVTFALLSAVSVTHGCGDGTGIDGSGNLRIDVNVGGSDRDPDGFLVSVDGGTPKAVAAAGSATYSEIPAGRHEVLLEGVAANCSVNGENPRTVEVAANSTTVTTFEVACVPATGTLEVTGTTIGFTVDGDGYAVTVDGDWTQRVAVNGALAFSFLAPGQHMVELADVAGNCTIDSPNPQTVEIVAGATTQTSFAVSCALDLSHDIAFVTNREGNWEIYLLVAGGSGAVNLTSHAADDFWPLWSPGGVKLAFWSERGDQSDIYAMNADGSGVVNLTNHAASDENPSWSPDASRIAFVSYRDGRSDVFVVNVDGSGVTNLTNHPDGDFSPDWSPDGERIAFVSDRGGDLDIYLLNPTSTEVENLTRHPSEDRLPVWSPDGTRIAFVSDRSGDDEIYVMNRDGSGVRNVTNRPWPFQESSPVWSPDQERIAFLSFRRDILPRTDIFTVRVDGGELRRLTGEPGDYFEPAWSPDGQKIAFTRFHRSEYEVYLMNADGSGLVNVSNHIEQDLLPSWRPTR